MSTITKERVAEIIHAAGLEPCDYEAVFESIKTGEIVAMARIALASLEAKDKIPELCQVIYHFRDWNEGFPIERFKADYVISWMLANYPPAPPAPVAVPDAMTPKQASRAYCGEVRGYRDGWNACRAAMLQGAENADSLPGIKPAPALDSLAKNAESLPGNSPVIPDGWVLVPVDPTEDMIVNGFESEPDESFSDEKEWEAYDAMSGCQQAAHRAKLCWEAMIKAAPKPENI